MKKNVITKYGQWDLSSFQIELDKLLKRIDTFSLPKRMIKHLESFIKKREWILLYLYNNNDKKFIIIDDFEEKEKALFQITITTQQQKKIDSEILKYGGILPYFKKLYSTRYTKFINKKVKNLLSYEEEIINALSPIKKRIDEIEEESELSYESKYQEKKSPLLAAIEWELSEDEFKNIIDRGMKTVLEYNDFNKVLSCDEKIVFISPNVCDNVKRFFKIISEKKYISDSISENTKIIENFLFRKKNGEIKSFKGAKLDNAKYGIHHNAGAEAKMKQFKFKMFLE